MVFHPISKHLEFRQTYSAVNSLLDDWMSDETLFLMSDILVLLQVYSI